ncbi:MAG TPA: RNB domain-containing ribonuclease, partial [Phaeodactylibacter sp.]|nr:RNB domain-containing ribonuclease [Phaeodactylibacter sp.]
HRFSYEQAQQVMNEGKGVFLKELLLLNELSKKLRKARFKNGAIAFDTEEVRFRLNEEGVPQEAYVKVRLEAHMLIEEFMLLANKSVAKFIADKGKEKEIPFVYRIHDLPNEEKVVELARFAAELGFKMDISTPKAIARSFNRMLKAAKENPALKVLEPIAIRTMAKAEYSTENIGHYGLAFSYYTHFTSPIRRYADVLVHRLLFKNLGRRVFRTDKATLEDQCRHISLQERKAQSAERESIRVKQAEYLEMHIGEHFKGRISGIIAHGFFVQLLDNLCEGMVRFDSFDEPFEVDEGRLKVVGRHTGRVFRMGDEVTVIVVGVDILRHRVDMVLDEGEG